MNSFKKFLDRLFGNTPTVMDNRAQHHPECKFRRAKAFDMPCLPHDLHMCAVCDPCTCDQHVGDELDEGPEAVVLELE